MGTDPKGTKSRDQVISGATFNPSIRVEERDEFLSGELGVLPMRELDERLQLIAKLADRIHDPRNPKFVVHSMSELFRTRLYSAIQGWGDQDDLDKLRKDSAFRLGVSDRTGDAPLRPADQAKDSGPAGLSSQPTHSRLIGNLSRGVNRTVLKEGLLEWAVKSLSVYTAIKPKTMTVDIDSSMWEIFGVPAGTSYNAHYGCNGYHPQLAYLHEARAWIGAQLRMGSTYSSTGAKEFLLPLLRDLMKQYGLVPRVRGDAAYPEEELLKALEDVLNEMGEESEIPYCFRLKLNNVLAGMATPFLRLPPGPRPKEPRSWTYNLKYRAKEWSRFRRVVLVVKEVPNELYPTFFFLVTNFEPRRMSGEEVWAFYKQRGEMEGDLAQLKTTLRPHLSSSDRTSVKTKQGRTPEEQFEADQKTASSNEATLLIFLLAYNMMRIGSSIMGQTCPEMDKAQSGHTPDPSRTFKRQEERRSYGWSLQRFREQVLKCAGRFLLGRNIVRVVVSEAGELWQRFWKAVCSLRALPS